FVMSDSKDSTVTYTEVSSAFEDLSDIGSPRVIEPPLPAYVPEPVYPEFMPSEDNVFPAEEQPLPIAVSPTADSPGYIADSDQKEDPKEDPADYPADGGDDDDDDESSDDDEDDDNDDVEEDEENEEEEEHLAPTDLSVIPIVDLVPSAEDTKVFKTDESAPTPPASPHHSIPFSETRPRTTRMSVRPQTPIPFPSREEVDRLLALSTPPSSPLTPLSSPLPQIPSPPFPVSPPLPISPSPLPASPTHPLGYRAAMIRLKAESPSTFHPLPLPPPIILPRTRASMVMMRAVAPSTYYLEPPSGMPPLLPILLPTSSPPLLIPSTDRRAEVPEAELPPQKRLYIAPGPRYEIGEILSAPTARPIRGFRRYYGFVATLDAEIRCDLDREIGQRMTDFVTTVRQDTDEIYGRLRDAQDARSLMSDHLNLLRRDRHSHARTARLMESEARLSCEAWVQSMDASDTARSETQMAALQRPARDPAHADKMAPKRTTRSTPATSTTTTTYVTDAQLKALIDQGVVDALAARDATRSKNGDDNLDS
ncbi:hypothetical protein Tco_0524948, partial [Tanacetum coccineum]